MCAFKKILFIDDDPIAITIYQRMMRLNNYCNDVVSCSNGQLAKDFLLQNTGALPDVIFLDINMHIMSGWDFLEWFEKWTVAIKINLPVYVVSSSVSTEDSDKSKTYKLVRGYISKPITMECLNKIALEHLK